VKLGSEIHLTDGTTVFALGTPGLGFHGSIHPSGLIKVSDNLGFDKRFDLSSPGLLNQARYATEAFVETLLSSMETEPEIDEDVIALVNPHVVERKLFRRTRHRIDLDPFAALRPPGLEFPFVIVEQEAVMTYLQTHDAAPMVMIAPESHRAVFATPGFDSVSFQFNFEDPMEFVRDLPFGDQIMETFQASIEYLRELPREAGIEPLGFIQAQFESLDEDELLADISDVLGGANPPALRRFTTEGFQPIYRDDLGAATQ